MKKENTVQILSWSFQLSSFVKSLKAIGWIIGVLTVVFALVVFTVSTVTFVPKYRSTVRFTITPLVSSNSSNGASVYNFNYNAGLASQMAATFPHIMKSGILYDIIRNEMGRPISVVVNSKAVSKTNIFEVSVTANSPDEAYEFILLLIENYPKVAEYVIGDTRMSVIEGSLPEKATAPYNTNARFVNAGFAAILGLAIGVLIVCIHSICHKSIVSKNDIEQKLNGDCISEIPLVKKKKTKTKTIVRSGVGFTDFSEAFRLLKQRVLSRCKLTGRKIIGVTSTADGEGKTTVAYNLARALAAGSSRVLLVDMDLRDRSLQEYLNRKKEVSDLGICDIVANKTTISECINSVHDKFDVLFAGSEQIKFHKAKFKEVFDSIKDSYDYIIVDLASCDGASESAATADLCEEVLFVVRWNGVSYEKILNAVKYMSFSSSHFMGFVLNLISPDEMIGGKYRYGHYYYSYSRRYGYGYGRYRYGYGKYASAYAKSPYHRHEPASDLSLSAQKAGGSTPEKAEK